MLNDARYVLRSIRKTPGLSLVIVVTLSLCIAATASVGNLINGYFQRIAVPEAQEVVNVYTGGPVYGPYGRTSYLDYRSYLEAKSFEGIAGTMAFGSSLEYQEETSWAWGALATGNFFDVLGVSPAAGRFFGTREQYAGGQPVAVLSYRYWQRQFQGSSEVLGQQIDLNGGLFTVIGVAPRAFVGLNAFYHPDLWTPIHHIGVVMPNGEMTLEDRSRSVLTLVGRLKDRGMEDAALQELASIAQQVEEMDPRGEHSRTVAVLPAYHTPPTAREWYLPTAKSLLIAVVFLLLLGCLNVAGLIFAKALARRQEMATRLALGGGRWSLVRLLFYEIFLLASVAGVIGFLSTLWTGARLSAYFAPPVVGARGDAPLFQPDLRVAAIVVAIVCATTIIVALIPGLRISQVSLLAGLKQQREGLPSRPLASAGSVMLALQVALSMALLTGTALVWQSMENMLHRDPGYVLDDVAIASIQLPTERYPTPEEGARFYRDTMTEILESGGVESISVAAVAPLSGYARQDQIVVPHLGEEPVEIDRSIVGPEYFDTLGIEIVEGRGFGLEHDRAAARVAVVNQTLAEKLFDGEGVVGREFLIRGTPITIIGVAEDTKYLSLQEEPRALAYYSFYQRFLPHLNLVMRSEQPIHALAPTIRESVRTLDVEAAVLFTTSLRQWLEGSIWEPRLRTDVLRVIGIIGLVLAAVGVYGLMQHRIVTGLKDLGLRLAIGARRRQILGLVLYRSARIGLLGVLIGLPLAFFAGRLVEGFLYGVAPFDPLILALVVLGLFAVILLAALLPGLRAARLNPLEVIRHD
ncbi:MAG: ADOP family duplicated permease [Acidobacteriota bacterium]